MANDTTVSDALCEDGESWPFTEEEIAAIRKYHSGKAKITTFKTADEAIKWLHK